MKNTPIHLVVNYATSIPQIIEEASLVTDKVRDYRPSKCSRGFWSRLLGSRSRIAQMWKRRKKHMLLFSVGGPSDGFLHLWRPADERELLYYCRHVGAENLQPEGLRAQGKIAKYRCKWPNGHVVKDTFVPVVVKGVLSRCIVRSYGGSELAEDHRDLWVRE